MVITRATKLFTGEPGDQGTSGQRGFDGEKGDKGERGFDGVRGPPGFSFHLTHGFFSHSQRFLKHFVTTNTVTLD